MQKGGTWSGTFSPSFLLHGSDWPSLAGACTFDPQFMTCLSGFEAGSFGSCIIATVGMDLV